MRQAITVDFAAMRSAAKILLGILLAAACLVSYAQTVSPKDFQVLEPARPVASGERIEVLEFFYYGCPVCYEAQPYIGRWLQKAGPAVALRRIPAAFTESSESFARTFYTLSAMNQVERLHWPLYDNHHFDGKELNEEKNIVAWVGENGVDAKRFSEIWHSAQIAEQVASAKRALDAYGVKGVPTFVVDGKYLTSARIAGSVPHMVETVQFLVERAAAERKK
jgi:protein dithiol oxidoreductase (disulfide-forming)